jgi:hypothetical protein
VPIDGGLGDALPAASTAVTITPPLLPTIGIGEAAKPFNVSFAWLRNVFIETTYWANSIKVSDVGGGLLNISHGYFENGFTDYIDNTFIDAGFGALAIDNCSFLALKGDHETIKASATNVRIGNCSLNNAPRTVPQIWIDGQLATLHDLRITGGFGAKGIELTSRALYCTLSDIYMYGCGKLDVSSTLFCTLDNIYVLGSGVASGSYAIDLGDHNSLVHAVVKGVAFGNNIAGGGIRAGYSKISDASCYYIDEAAIKTTAAASQVLGCKAEIVGTPFDLASGTISANNNPWADGLVYSNAAASTPVTSTDETDFNKSYTIDANRLRVGSVIRVRAQAVLTSDLGGGTLTLRLKIGSTVIESTGAIAVGSPFLGYFDSTLIVRSVGPSGTIVGTTAFALGTDGVVNPRVGFLGVTAIDTTASQAVKVSAQFSDDDNSVRLDVLTVEILNGPTVG